MSDRLPLLLALLLALAHVALTLVDGPRRADTTYVLTPMVDVWPEGPPLSAAEGQALGKELRHGVDAREISQAYGTLGATLSLAELLAGIEGLDGELAPSPPQRDALLAILDGARRDHAALVALQREILDAEASVATRVMRLELLTGVSPRPPGPPR